MPILRQSGPSQAQLSRLFAILTANGLDRDDLDALMEQEGMGDDLHTLTTAQYDELVACVESFGEVPRAG